jgi:two-component system, LytTR family, sensor kinase
MLKNSRQPLLPAAAQNGHGTAGRAATKGSGVFPEGSPFWKLQLVGWPAYGLILFIGVIPYVGTAPHLDSWPSVLCSKIAFTLLGFLCSSALGMLYSRQSDHASRRIRMVSEVILLSYGAGLITTLCSNIARELASGKHLGESWTRFFGGAINASAVFLAWSACYFAIRSYYALEDEKRESLRANAIAHQAQLEMLRSQVNPHFLFNSLNSIHALTRENPERAQIAIEELAEFLRYSLARGKTLKVPLSEEIEVLERYLALERIRFEEKLSASMEMQPAMGRVSVPAFLLHPVLENAIKYGMQTSAMPLRVRVTAERRGESLRVAIANTGRWVTGGDALPQSSGNGRGLQIVRDRLDQEYPGRHQLDCRESNGWVESVILIPLSAAEVG